jgi:hypothetical protein
MYQEIQVIKDRFFQLMGDLSIEEIMSNPALIERMKCIRAMLLSVAAGKGVPC